jgi:hypothetical protein
VGKVCGLGTVYGVVPASVVTHSARIWGRGGTGDGKLFGRDLSVFAKLNALVISPTVARRHALKFGTSAPNRVSRN